MNKFGLYRSVFVALILILITIRVGAQPDVLPDWSKAGYRGTGTLPTDNEITDDPSCIVTTEELVSIYGVQPDDQLDDSAGLQQAIDDIREGCKGSYDRLSLIELPTGTLNTATEIHLDANFLIMRGQGADLTHFVFEPGPDTLYDNIPNFDLGAMKGAGTSNGGWIWPGRGAFRIQPRAVHDDYAKDYTEAPPNRRDFYEGSVNFHWKAGIEINRNSAEGDLTIVVEDTEMLSVGGYVWVAAPNTANMYILQGVQPDDWSWQEYMRQQIFTVTAIDGETITLDRALEFDLPYDSTADGSAPIDGEVREAKIVPLTVIEGVGLEGFSLTQIIPDRDPAEAEFNYTNLDPARAQHGFVFKWAVNSYLRDVETFMTGSHAVVTEMVRHVQIEDSTFVGAWNKGAGGNGYFRLSKAWDSLIQNNTMRGLRHLAVQWSASHNVIQDNDIDADLNLHGGWERYNLFQNNVVRVPSQHRECSPDCQPEDETWHPIWWGAGAHAGSWAGATGPLNVFFNNTLQKQHVSGGDYGNFGPYGTNAGTVFIFGWDRTEMRWKPLVSHGTPIETWTGNETFDFTLSPYTGVDASCTSDAASLIGATLDCAD